ncbi:MAG: hypothetical protein LBU96_14765 [Yokenella regensburgei]|jgi:hypothetical protein|nr:hypothetical protein [Yokenella regensburgei]
MAGNIFAERQRLATIAADYGCYSNTPAIERFRARLQLLDTYATESPLPSEEMAKFRQRFTALEEEAGEGRHYSWPGMHRNLNVLEGDIYAPILVRACDEFSKLKAEQPELTGLKVACLLAKEEIDDYRKRHPETPIDEIAHFIAQYSPRFDALIYLARDPVAFSYHWRPLRLPLQGF